MVCKWIKFSVGHLVVSFAFFGVPFAKVKSGNKQYRCGKTMMLTTDMALIEDPKFKDGLRGWTF